MSIGARKSMCFIYLPYRSVISSLSVIFDTFSVTIQSSCRFCCFHVIENFCQVVLVAGFYSLFFISVHGYHHFFFVRCKLSLFACSFFRPSLSCSVRLDLIFWCLALDNIFFTFFLRVHGNFGLILCISFLH